MVDDLVETLRREPGLLLDQMLANSGGTHERLGCETVMEVPKEVRRDNPAQRIHVVLEQGTMFAGHDLGAADGKPRFVTRLHFWKQFFCSRRTEACLWHKADVPNASPDVRF
jgi:hypothetical protein